MKKTITDINMHVIPLTDRAEVDCFMALDMLQIAYDNGVRDIFCPFHSVMLDFVGESYKDKFLSFIRFICEMHPDRFHGLTLYPCCEVHCNLPWLDKILLHLQTGNFPSMGFTRYVLIALYPDITPEITLQIINELIANNWIPILSHAEFYPLICNDSFIEKLISLGVKIQVNLFSLEEETRTEIKECARYLVNKKYAHFIGSYTHSFKCKPPHYEKGLKYLSENCDEKYFDEICFLNAESIIKEARRIFTENQ